MKKRAEITVRLDVEFEVAPEDGEFLAELAVEALSEKHNIPDWDLDCDVHRVVDA